MNYARVIGGAMATLALAVGLIMTDHSMREEMRSASAEKRNKAFTGFLDKHGKSCKVIESDFGGAARHDNFKGDLWSLRCEEKHTYALVLSDDPKDQTWIIGCGDALRIGDFVCFGSYKPMTVFR